MAATALTALYDANVLYPSELRNLLMHSALTGLFRAKWSAAIHEEWISSLLANRPELTRMQLERTRILMDKHAVDAIVRGYEQLIPILRLPDANDRHVLAAAIHCRANVIVTMNVRDFPAKALSRFGIKAQRPDEFILQLIDRNSDAVAAAAHDHRKSLKSPSKTFEEYLTSLDRQGLKQIVAILRNHRL